MPASISRTALTQSIAAGAVLVVEALGFDFYRSGHLPSAVNLPLSSMDELLERTVAAADLPIVVYGTGISGEAMELAHRLERLTDRTVLVYTGGKEEWVEAGLPIVTSEADDAEDSAGFSPNRTEGA